MADEDEFDALSFLSLTSEDLEQIDLVCALALSETNAQAARASNGPLLSIGVEHGDTIDEYLKTSSPYAQYRFWRNSLSVLDIVSPAWCEVQFDYGLQQRRSLPLKSRPPKFVTPTGKEVKVVQKVAVKNDERLKAGQVIHKKLEKEVHKETIHTETKTKEDAWALRILNFLTRMQSLRREGFCRELPISGVIENQLIVGVIDEIRVAQPQPRPSLSSQLSMLKQQPGNPTSEAKQTPINSYFARNPATANVPSNITLQIIDNKTRNSSTVPWHADTLPSRLQLMLYYRLISSMLAVGTTHFRDVWKHESLNASKPFSSIFKEELNKITLESGLALSFLDANCLEDIVMPFHDTIDALGINREIDSSLFLVYRPRHPTTEGSVNRGLGKRRKRQYLEKQKRARTATRESSPPMTEEHLATGSSSLIAVVDSILSCSSHMAHNSLDHVSDTGNTHPSKPTTDFTSESGSESDGSFKSKQRSPSPLQNQPEIIGTKKFQYNEKVLMNHLRSILQWWRGKRDAKGVDVGLTYRCNSCEYRQDCEWREMKAREITTQQAIARSSSRDRGKQQLVDLSLVVESNTNAADVPLTGT